MYGKLESLRGVAALLVVLYHSSFSFGDRSIAFIGNSYLFVDFFFILSGFVMALAYGDRIHRDMPFWRYIALRLGRIYPLHLFMLLAWVPYILAKQYLYNSGFGGSDPSEKANLTSFFSNLFLIHGMGLHDYVSWNFPSWSISVELFAYIAFYAITATFDRSRNLYVPVVISLTCYAFIFSLDRPDIDYSYDFGFFRCLGSFYLGVFLFRLGLDRRPFESRAMMSVLEVVSAGFLIIAVSLVRVDEFFSALSLVSFACVLVVFSFSTNGILGRLLETSALRHLGIWSYSVYLVHGLVLAGLHNVFEYVLKVDIDAAMGVKSLFINGLALAITIVVSRYTYTHIEKRFRDQVKTWVSNKDRNASGPKAPGVVAG
ncbi:acyltransferase family protein [Marinobacter sp. 1Y8]